MFRTDAKPSDGSGDPHELDGVMEKLFKDVRLYATKKKRPFGNKTLPSSRFLLYDKFYDNSDLRTSNPDDRRTSWSGGLPFVPGFFSPVSRTASLHKSMSPRFFSVH